MHSVQYLLCVCTVCCILCVCTVCCMLCVCTVCCILCACTVRCMLCVCTVRCMLCVCTVCCILCVCTVCCMLCVCTVKCDLPCVFHHRPLLKTGSYTVGPEGCGYLWMYCTVHSELVPELHDIPPKTSWGILMHPGYRLSAYQLSF